MFYSFLNGRMVSPEKAIYGAGDFCLDYFGVVVDDGEALAYDFVEVGGFGLRVDRG